MSKTKIRDDITSINNTLADKANQASLNATNDNITNLQNGKVDKNGSGQVTYAMLAQDARTSMTGGSVAVVGKDAVLEENLANGVVVPKKTNFFSVNKNLYNNNDINYSINSSIDYTNGSIVVNNSYDVTGYINVKPGDIIVVAYTNTNGVRTIVPMRHIAQYDTNKTFVTDNYSQPNTFTVPAGIYYIRASIYKDYLNEIQIEVTTNGIPTSYQPFSETINADKYIKNSSIKGKHLEYSTISVDKLNFSKIGDNLIDANDYKNYILGTNGEHGINANYKAFLFIPVIGGKSLIFGQLISDKTSYTSPTIKTVLFHDKDGLIVQYYTDTTINNMLIPVGASFLSFCIQTTTDLYDRRAMLSYTDIFSSLSQMLGNYKPYKYSINFNNINSSELQGELDKIRDGSTIKEKAVNPYQSTIAVLNPNGNLITDINFTEGYTVSNNGLLIENSQYGTSDYIPVIAGKTILGGMLNSTLEYMVAWGVCNLAFYNSDKSYLSNSYASGIAFSGYTIPSNAYYMRISVMGLTKALIKSRMAMITYSNVYSTVPNMKNRYLPYQYVLNKDILVDCGNWFNKVWLSYGDSITQIGNANGANSWQDYVNQEIHFKDHYGRGIGGQTFRWNTNTFWANPDGSYAGRPGGESGSEQVTQPANTTEHKGCFCAWDRITSMIPVTIKDTVDLIFVMGGTNDQGQNVNIGDITWNANNTTDSDWVSASGYYNGGDFDINTYKGGIASCIVKLQAWCPNAVIVFGTPLNGRGVTGLNGTTEALNTLNLATSDYAKAMKEVCNIFGIQVIDVFSNAGINMFNRTSYISDSVHPYYNKGKKALARVIVGGLKSIYPNIF